MSARILSPAARGYELVCANVVADLVTEADKERGANLTGIPADDVAAGSGWNIAVTAH
jgi:hypothetical protein